MCQQAAEKALKAVYAERGAETWGHSVRHLLRGLHNDISPDEFRTLAQCARNLDTYYIPTQYPDRVNGGAPYENYQQADAAAARDCAQRIVRTCDDLLAR